MATNKEHSLLVEKYFDGNMSGSEKMAFENELASDPILKSEFEHQQEIVHGLKEFRKMELKARLDNIPVTPGLLGVISQSSAVKTMSYVAATLLIGTGAYFMIKEDRAESYIQLLDPKLKYTIGQSELGQIENSLDYRYETSSNVPNTWVEVATVDSSEPKVREEKLPKAVNPASFQVPDISDPSPDESPIQGEELLADAPVRLDKLSSAGAPAKIEIENIIADKYNFHYRLENGKLYLYGKFDVSPYKILEVNSKTGKKLFFHYDGNYFRLFENTRSISPLEVIDDQNLIDELKIIKSK